jgi:hypothetical protein
MAKRRPSEIVQVNLRLRESFRQELLRASEKSGRSFNQELVHRLEQSFTQDSVATILEKVGGLLDQAGISRADRR